MVVCHHKMAHEAMLGSDANMPLRPFFTGHQSPQLGDSVEETGEDMDTDLLKPSRSTVLVQAELHGDENKSSSEVVFPFRLANMSGDSTLLNSSSSRLPRAGKV